MSQRLRRSTVLCLFALTGCGAASASTEPTTSGTPIAATATLDDLAWLAGSWRSDDQHLGEEWSREGESLRGRGVSYIPTDCAAPEPGEEAACDDAIAVTEMLEITTRDGGLVYIATPIDQARTEFVLTEVDGTHFVAENPEHDFPTRIEYRVEGESIRARVSGPERAFEILFLRR